MEIGDDQAIGLNNHAGAEGILKPLAPLRRKGIAEEAAEKRVVEKRRYTLGHRLAGEDIHHRRCRLLHQWCK